MKYKVDGWNNICRVFELPNKFSDDYCFNPIPTTFLMVDWFYPIEELDQPAVTKEIWKEKGREIEVKEVTIQELYDMLVPFLRKKTYIKSSHKYLVVCDFGATFLFTNE